MTLAEKRQVIEVLMCVSDARNLTYVDDLIGQRTGEPLRVALELRHAVLCDSVDPYGYGESCVEAAYRLIESHPALRAEWFT